MAGGAEEALVGGGFAGAVAAVGAGGALLDGADAAEVVFGAGCSFVCLSLFTVISHRTQLTVRLTPSIRPIIKPSHWTQLK